MHLVQATKQLAELYVNDIAELVWATGAVSYEYHFGTRALFDSVVEESWMTEGTLFAYDATTLAIEDEALLGIEIGMRGTEYRSRGGALAKVWTALIEREEINPDDLPGVLQRSDAASWLNPVIHEDTYYIHALVVKPEARGKRLGYKLINDAIQRARDEGYRKLQLDVLSDNPAVGFYQGLGLELLAETTAPKPREFGVPTEYRMGSVL